MKKTVLLLVALAVGLSTKAQIDPTQFMKGSKEDANYLGGEYLRPFGNSLAHGLNNGWYQTAKPKNLGRFSIMITPSLIRIPADQQSFLIENSKLNSLELVQGIQSSSPTAFGDKEAGPALRFKGDTVSGESFKAPGGAGIAWMAVPMANVSIGLVKNTEISLRYLPTMGIPGLDKAQIGMFGLGVKHDILQWIPMDKVIPVDVSLFFGYTKFDLNIPLDEGDQEVALTSTGYTMRALVSKKLAFFTPYLGLGYNSGKTDINVNGTFSTDYTVGGNTHTLELEDPVDITADDAGGFVGNVGFRVKFLWVLAFSADYTFGYYNSATAGLGLSLDF